MTRKKLNEADQLRDQLEEANQRADDERRRRLEHFEAMTGLKRDLAEERRNLDMLKAAIVERDERIKRLEAGELESLSLLSEAKRKLDAAATGVKELEETVELERFKLAMLAPGGQNGKRVELVRRIVGLADALIVEMERGGGRFRPETNVGKLFAAVVELRKFQAEGWSTTTIQQIMSAVPHEK